MCFSVVADSQPALLRERVKPWDFCLSGMWLRASWNPPDGMAKGHFRAYGRKNCCALIPSITQRMLAFGPKPCNYAPRISLTSLNQMLELTSQTWRAFLGCVSLSVHPPAGAPIRLVSSPELS